MLFIWNGIIRHQFSSQLFRIDTIRSKTLWSCIEAFLNYYGISSMLKKKITYEIVDDVKVNPLKFHFMESLCHTAILKKLEFLRQISKKQNMIKKNYQLNWTKKFVDKAQQCFAFLPIKPEFKFSVEWSWFLET